ncbi:hypothetical protein [Streptomyces chromofuscus]|uniref:Uncharacterized protein n=1 Tax=Streptomyces chromofuscus TaxID=42881 RepID=A0A7M2T1L3_STRCW|nr:hypothetical protein [Streptomyces chromofuscus]QOV42540.1 hypothetical protein IPT68_22260 [Streptomyces chromofuscus]GGT30725.1 hypothetical protein GCM10010254_59120 [Streptomyces chromofuscus]
MAVVTFVDETTTGDRGEGRELEVAEERRTRGEVIRRRVFQEAAEYITPTPGVFQGLVRPWETERARNGQAPRTVRRMDPEAATEPAPRAFAGNGFLVLVGDRQVIDPDEEIDLGRDAEVMFLKPVPLVGG